MKRMIQLMLCLALLLTLFAGCGATEQAAGTDKAPSTAGDPSPETNPPESLTSTTDCLSHFFDGFYGVPISSFFDQIVSKITLLYENCIVWTQSDDASPDQVRIYAAVAGTQAELDDDWTVAGLIAWTEQPDGTRTCESEGVQPIDPVTDPCALAGKTKEELETLLGPCHCGRRYKPFTPCWFTRDGKLLTFFSYGIAVRTDLLTGEKEYFAEPDVICVLQRVEASTITANEPRWEAFLERTAGGMPDAVTIRRINIDAQNKDGVALSLAYDGQVYTVTDEDGSESFPYLIVSTEEAPSAQAKYSSAVYYLLSEDPDMTWQRYFGQKVAASPDPDTPKSRTLFNVYRFDG